MTEQIWRLIDGPMLMESTAIAGQKDVSFFIAPGDVGHPRTANFPAYDPQWQDGESTGLPSVLLGRTPQIIPEVKADEYEPLEREQEMAWLASHVAELAVYAGQWIALVGQQMIAHAATLRELRALTQEQGYADPLMVPVPPRDAVYR